MRNQIAKKITWVIKNFPSLQSKVTSDPFIVGGCRWRLLAYPKGYKIDNQLSLYLEVDNYNSETLSPGWRRQAQYRLSVLNQNFEKNYQRKQIQYWFEKDSPNWGFPSMIAHNVLYAKDSGYVVNGEVKIAAEVEVLEVTGKVDVSDETTSIITETMDVNGFHLLPSQVEFASRMFKKHPEIASGFRSKNPNLKTAYMSFLHSLVETMCQSPHELSKEDIADAHAALEFMKKAGFKLDWLENRFNEVLEKKENEKVAETRLEGIEAELENLKLKCSNMEAMVEMEKAKVLAAKAPLVFDNLV